MPIHEFLGIAYNPNMKFLFIYVVLFLVVLLVLYIKHRLTGCRSGAPGRRCARTRSPVARWASTMCW